MKLEERNNIINDEKSKIKVRFYRTNYPCKNKNKKGAFTKEFQSIRELKQFIEMLNVKRSNIYPVALYEDLAPSQIQAFQQNMMNKVIVRKALEKRKKNGIEKYFDFYNDEDSLFYNDEDSLRKTFFTTYKNIMKRI